MAGIKCDGKDKKGLRITALWAEKKGKASNETVSLFFMEQALFIHCDHDHHPTAPHNQPTTSENIFIEVV